MAPEVDATAPPLAHTLVGQRIQTTTRPARQDDQQVRQAISRREDASQQVRDARTDVQEANRRLQDAMTREQRAGEQVRTARAEQQEAVRDSQSQLRGRFVSVLV